MKIITEEVETKTDKYTIQLTVYPNTAVDIELYTAIQFIGKLYSQVLEDKNRDKYLYIQDIHIHYPNKGYGTVILQRLIKYCKDNSIKYITGSICKFDYNDHGPLLVAFYHKNKFNVRIFGDIKNGIEIGEIKYNINTNYKEDN